MSVMLGVVIKRIVLVVSFVLVCMLVIIPYNYWKAGNPSCIKY